MSRPTRGATRDDLPRLWPVVAEARLFPDFDAFALWWGEAPWRVRLSEEGSTMVLGRWREHLPFLAVLGLWCPRRRVAPLVADAVSLARERGFERVLGPLVPEEDVEPYLEAGLEIRQRVVVCRRRVRGAPNALAEADAKIREGCPADEDAVLALDVECFDDLWRYDRPTFRAISASGSLMLAERGDRIIGYTLWVAHGTEATVARLAVDPMERGRGLGTALLREAVANAAELGARSVTLSTQEENEVSRRLYRREGFAESPGRLVNTITPPLGEAPGRSGRE